MNKEIGIDGFLNTSVCIEKFINLCMRDGKKNKSYQIISKILYRLSLFEQSKNTKQIEQFLVNPVLLRRTVNVLTQVSRASKNKQCDQRAALLRRRRCGSTEDSAQVRSKGSTILTSYDPGSKGPTILQPGRREVNQPAALNQTAVLQTAREQIHKAGDQEWNQTLSLSNRNSVPVVQRLGSHILVKAINNVKPTIEVKKVRISGTTQLVPSIISKNRQISLAIRWLLEAAKQRRFAKKSMTLDHCFFIECIEAYQNIGSVRKKRDELHRLAESNRGFSHYRWWNR